MADRVEILPPEQHEPLPPLPYRVVPNGHKAWVRHGFIANVLCLRPVCTGIGLTWSRTSQRDNALLILTSGTDALPEEIFVTELSRDALRLLIADLQSIDRQLEDEA